MRSKEALLSFLKDSVNGLLHETQVQLCELNSHITKKFLWKLLSSFHLWYFLCHRKVHYTMKYQIADFQKTVLTNWSQKWNL